MKKQNQIPNQLKDSKPSKWMDKARARKENRAWQNLSFEIALRVYDKLKSDKSLSQRWLAEQLDVSPQYVGKMLKGKENLTLQTIVRLEKALGLQLISVSKEVASLSFKLPNEGMVASKPKMTVTVNNHNEDLTADESISTYETFSIGA